MEIKVKKLHPKARLPVYGRKGDSGLDLFTTQKIAIKPGEKKEIPTGIAIELPDGFAGLLWAKGGLGLAHGLIVLGGVIDSNYRGEYFVGIYNASKKEYVFNIGDKVAQVLIQPVERAIIKEVRRLSSSVRGAKMKGSSGR